jgi:ABC-type polysaccharide/polyol phosphate export permease
MHFLKAFRSSLHHGDLLTLQDWTILLAFAAVFAAVGFVAYVKLKNRFIYNL